jgi:single-stranded-DNA-specific exonuclease
MLKTKTIQRRTPRADSVLQNEMPAVLRRVYANRNIADQSELDYSVQGLLPFELLKGIKAAAEIVARAIMEQQHIMIVGDYDADGATSTTLVMRALRALGSSHCSYLVPNRFEFGYGLTPAIVEVAHTRQPDLIITVDNGISSIEGVKTAQAHNIAVVITDHHLAGNELPPAEAIVNPNQPGCEFPEKSIAGVGVAFYLMLATRAALREHHWFDQTRAEPNMASLLDLVALGTVADVVPLEKNNRLMVQLGLQRIRKRHCSAGIQALMEVAGKDIAQCSSADFGFFVAPRLNAAGRLEDMSAGIECLLTDNHDAALSMAAQLHALNQDRRQIETEMLNRAMKHLDELIVSLNENDLPLGLCLYDSHWHQGVVGLLASRIKDRFHRPVLAFADASNGAGEDEIKGSARSIPGLHIRDVLDSVATLNPGLIDKFGGHAMAAGLSLKKSNYERFKQAFEAAVASQLSEDALENIIYTDGNIDTDEMTLETAAALRLAGPWGQQFPEPVFDDVFEIINWRIVGEKHLKLELRRAEATQVYDAIAFNHTNSDLPAGKTQIRAVYRMDVNEFRGVRKLQLIVDYIEAA